MLRRIRGGRSDGRRARRRWVVLQSVFNTSRYEVNIAELQAKMSQEHDANMTKYRALEEAITNFQRDSAASSTRWAYMYEDLQGSAGEAHAAPTLTTTPVGQPKISYQAAAPHKP